MVREITRQEAEVLLNDGKVTSTRVEQKNNELSVLLTLADDHTCVVRFDRHNGEKHYFVQGSKLP